MVRETTAAGILDPFAGEVAQAEQMKEWDQMPAVLATEFREKVVSPPGAIVEPLAHVSEPGAEKWRYQSLWKMPSGSDRCL